MASDGEAPNYYELLCVEPNATKDDIRKAYRRQALLFHPDKMKPHMQDEASQHFQLISEAYEVLSDDKKRDLYDRYGYEGVKAGGDPNPPPAPDPFMNMHTQRQASGFGFGFDSPFFSAFGMPAHHQHFHGGYSTSSSPSPFNNAFGSNHEILAEVFSGDQAFAGHHQRHMRNMEQHMGSMFEPFGGFAQPPPPMFRDDPFFNRGFDMPHTAKPTLFSTSPFASEWTGSGTSTNPLTNFGGGFTSSSSSSSSFGGGGGARTSTRTTIVNGLRTTVTEVTDEHGVTRKTVDKPDGTREVYVNGVPAAIEGGAAQASAAQDGNRQEPIVIEDDDPQHLYHPRMGRGHTLSGQRGSSRT
ncbi:hypothetical protein KVV02_006990 [Mortierella alpina]|uniref:J domain-containing protein n=1 Tax=Mortierella alpina TaxID=64518 RepID=A0A9P7ZZG7_MORAP|nr:hypothetical protein KVV02_006990 [Mortierella alpina]